MDGAASQDSGNLNAGYINPSMDAIGEVKLLVSNYTAEYGGRTAGQLTMSTKNGTPQFHGSAYWYYRHESLNANTFFNNKTNVPRPRYRYQNPGGTIGGPLIIPGTRFNKARQKLFFFFSYDKLFNSTVNNATYTMPTALERTGDFSKTVTTTGVQVPIFDPNTQTPFPGNVIPSNRISPQGQAMLNLFPLPDPAGLALDPTGNRGYNFRAVLPQIRPLDDKILRVDYNISPKLQTFVRLLQDYQAVNGYNVTVGPPGGAWGQFPASYHVQSAGALGTLIYTISPTLINEFSWGINRGLQGVNPLSDTSGRCLHRRRQDLCAEPAAAQGCERQRSDPAAHQPGQQLPEPAAGGQTSAYLPASPPSPPARALPALPRSAWTPAGPSPAPTSCRPSRTI